MNRWKINRSQRKTALKMAKTIFDRASISMDEASDLLMNCLRLALRDLLDSGFVQWSRPLPDTLTLIWTAGMARTASRRKGSRCLTHYPEDDVVDQAFEGCEALFDRYQLAEDERDTLFTALPCLGFVVLEAFLDWKKKPPFPEVN